MNFKTLNVVDTECRSAEGRLGTFCLPSSENCRPTCLFTDNCWNDRRCQNEPKAYMPWFEGDVIQFQTNFPDVHHVDPENPSDPFAPTASIGPGSSYRAILCFPGGEERQLDLFASASMVAWSGTHSYQIVEVDTSLPIFDSLDCWELRIEALDGFGDPVDGMNTETFQRISSCDDTVVIRSSYASFDCCGNFYGSPVAFAGDEIKYRNTLRMWGLVHELGFASAANFDFTTGAISESSRTLYRFNTTRWYPPYQRKLLQNLMEPSNFTIDGIQYDRPGYSVEGGRFKINLIRACNVANIC